MGLLRYLYGLSARLGFQGPESEPVKPEAVVTNRAGPEVVDMGEGSIYVHVGKPCGGSSKLRDFEAGASCVNSVQET